MPIRYAKEVPAKDIPEKYAVIIYHKKVNSYYKKEWVDKCVQSIEMQTNPNFTLMELCYGDNAGPFLEDLLERKIKVKNHIKYFQSLPNHVHAQNFLLDRCFADRMYGTTYSVVFNTNIDDFYSKDRIDRQIEFVKMGYELVSSDFQYVEEVDGFDTFRQSIIMSNKGIKEEIVDRDHNILCHPVIAYTKEFWDKFGPYTDSIPKEDLLLWKKAVMDGANIGIVPKTLCYYRLHPNQVSRPKG
jgi:hypothetical protein